MTRANSAGRRQRGRGQAIHPVLALQVVNHRTKELDAQLKVAMPSTAARALIRERGYLYELKHRAAVVLLSVGWLRPFGVSGALLMVEGDAPNGRCQFHLPAALFGPYAVETAAGRSRPLPPQARLTTWRTPQSVEEGVAALTRLIARGQIG